MGKVTSITFAACLAGVVFACSKNSSDSSDSGAAASASAAPSASVAAAEPPPTDTATAPPPTSTAVAAGAETIGVKECDDYIIKWHACYKDPATRAAAKPGLDQMTSAWKQAASTPQGRAGLANGCKKALDNFPSAACSGGGSSGPIGVKECDDYINKWNACYKDPATRAAAKPGLDAMTKAWKDAANSPQGKVGLAKGCKSALDSFPAAACK